MKIALGVRIGVTAALALLFSSPALHASTTWDWSYSSNLYSGSGTFTTDSTLTSVGGFSGYLIQSATGTWNGASIALLGTNGLGSNDNLLGSSAPLLDDNGVAFKTTADSFNIYNNGLGYQAYGLIGIADNANGQFSATLDNSVPSAATPEPASLSLVLTGVLGAAAAARRRLSA